MKKTFCDICDEEIEGKEIVVDLEYSDQAFVFDICPKCMDKVRELFKIEKAD